MSEKTLLYVIGGVVLAPIAIGAVYGLIQGGAWVVQHAIVNPLFEAKMKKREKEGTAVKINGSWFEVVIDQAQEA